MDGAIIRSLPGALGADMNPDIWASLDLGTVLNSISTVAIVGALIFTGLQVRQANLSRRDQAAVTVIQTSQSDSWAHALELLARLPAGATLEDVEAFHAEMGRALFDYGVKLETIGYMVFRRMAPLSTVDDLMGGVVLMYWSRAKAWVEHERVRTDNPKFFEWCQWLAERIQQLRARRGHEPAHTRHRLWRE
jgi:hypothetical protein